MLSIVTNSAAMRAMNAIRVAEANIQTSVERISTGKRINSFSDDPGNFFRAMQMASDIQGMQQAQRNVGDGISFAQTADGALSGVTDMMQRIRELAVESASGTYSDADRANMQTEVSSLVAQIKSTLTDSQFNGQKLYRPAGTGDAAITIQSGSDTGQTANIGIEDYDLTKLSQLSVATASDATATISLSDDVMKAVNTSRARLGATMNTLSMSSDSLDNQLEIETEAYGRIMDVDYGAETTALAKNQLILNAATAMLAQANQMPCKLVSMLLNEQG